METGTSIGSGHTGVDTVNTKGSTGAFATLYMPFVARARHVGHGYTSIGDVVDDVGSFCRSVTLCCLANVAGGKVDNNKGDNKKQTKKRTKMSKTTRDIHACFTHKHKIIGD